MPDVYSYLSVLMAFASVVLLFMHWGLFSVVCVCVSVYKSVFAVGLCVYVHVLRWVARCLLYCLQCVFCAAATGKPQLPYALAYALQPHLDFLSFIVAKMHKSVVQSIVCKSIKHYKNVDINI